jgi:hypothetical protein
MLGGLIECAVWHSHWTNTLYNDRFALLAFLLDWHARAPPHNPRFVGENLYALLFTAKYSVWLLPLTAPDAETLHRFNPESLRDSHDPDGLHAFLQQRANQVLQRLPPKEKVLYRNLERTFKAHLASEYQSLCKVLTEEESDAEVANDAEVAD